MNISRKVIAIALGLMLVVSFNAVQAHGLFDFIRGDCVIGSGDLKSESRDLDDFSSIEANGSFDVIISCGESQSVVVMIDDNLLDMVETRVRNGVLEIGSLGSFSSHSHSRIEISLPYLESLRLDGSGDIIVHDAEGDEVDISLNGSGKIDINGLRAKLLTVSISGSGDLTGAGTSEELDVRLSGSGDVDLRDLHAEDAAVRVSGSGDVKVFVTGRLTGHVNGSGDIHYSGNPDRVSRNISGSGDIKRKR